jgi:hypothetical protein
MAAQRDQFVDIVDIANSSSKNRCEADGLYDMVLSRDLDKTGTEL